MQTRIRHLRKSRNWTLQQLSERVGTTAQTIQRLETENMTVSMEWLEKVANAFSIKPEELIAENISREVPFLGTMSQNATLRTDHQQACLARINLDVPAPNPIAVKLGEPAGAYTAGSVLIADKLSGRDMTNALGRDVIAAPRHDLIVLARLIKGEGDTYTLVPLQNGEAVRYNQELIWVGRIVMRVDFI